MLTRPQSYEVEAVARIHKAKAEAEAVTHEAENVAKIHEAKAEAEARTQKAQAEAETKFFDLEAEVRPRGLTSLIIHTQTCKL